MSVYIAEITILKLTQINFLTKDAVKMCYYKKYIIGCNETILISLAECMDQARSLR